MWGDKCVSKMKPKYMWAGKGGPRHSFPTLRAFTAVQQPHPFPLPPYLSIFLCLSVSTSENWPLFLSVCLSISLSPLNSASLRDCHLGFCASGCPVSLGLYLFQAFLAHLLPPLPPSSPFNSPSGPLVFACQGVQEISTLY